MGRLECEGTERSGEHLEFCRNASKKAVAPCDTREVNRCKRTPGGGIGKIY